MSRPLNSTQLSPMTGFDVAIKRCVGFALPSSSFYIFVLHDNSPVVDPQARHCLIGIIDELLKSSLIHSMRCKLLKLSISETIANEVGLLTMAPFQRQCHIG